MEPLRPSTSVAPSPQCCTARTRWPKLPVLRGLFAGFRGFPYCVPGEGLSVHSVSSGALPNASRGNNGEKGLDEVGTLVGRAEAGRTRDRSRQFTRRLGSLDLFGQSPV